MNKLTLLPQVWYLTKKSRLVRDIVARSDHPHKASILSAFNKLQAHAKRDNIIHSYIESGKDYVTFVHKSSGGEYDAKPYRFTLKEFREHVSTMSDLSNEFHKSLQYDEKEYQDFAHASLSASRSERKSPGNPKSSK